LGIIAGAWMFFQPVLVTWAQPDESVAGWYLLLTMAPALLLIYFGALAWTRIFQNDESRRNVQ